RATTRPTGTPGPGRARGTTPGTASTAPRNGRTGTRPRATAAASRSTRTGRRTSGGTGTTRATPTPETATSRRATTIRRARAIRRARRPAPTGAAPIRTTTRTTTPTTRTTGTSSATATAGEAVPGQTRRSTATTLPMMLAWSPGIGSYAGFRGSSHTLPSRR